MFMLSENDIAKIKSPCRICKVTSCGETSIRVTFERTYVKILDYSDTRYEVRTYVCGDNYCSDFPMTIVKVPKERIGEYLSRF